MRRARHGVFGYREFRRENSAHAVEIFIGGSHGLNQSVQRGKFALIRAQSFNGRGIVQNHQQIAVKVSLPNFSVDGVAHCRSHGNFFRRVCGKIHLEKISLALNAQSTAQRLERHGGRIFVARQNHEARRKRGVSAKIYFGRRREPAQSEIFAVAHDKRRLRQIIFARDIEHEFSGRKFVDDANRRRVAAENFVRERVDDKLFHVNHSQQKSPPNCAGRKNFSDVDGFFAEDEAVEQVD